MPKLTTLTTKGRYSWTFGYPRHITLESGPSPLLLTPRHPQSHSSHASKRLREQKRRHDQWRLQIPLSLTARHWGSSNQVAVLSFVVVHKRVKTSDHKEERPVTTPKVNNTQNNKRGTTSSRTPPPHTGIHITFHKTRTRYLAKPRTWSYIRPT